MSRLLVIALVLCFVVNAVDRSKFKRCDQNSFCKRQRSFKDGILDYKVVPGSFDFDGTSLKFHLHETKTDIKFILQVARYPDNVVRLRMNEREPLQPRHVPQEVLLDGLKMVPFASFTQDANQAVLTLDSQTQFVISLQKLKFELVVDGTPVVSANSRGLLYFEHLRAKKDDAVVDTSAEPEQLASAEWDISQFVDMKDAWSESFGSHHEQNSKGPQSIGLDISFNGADQVYGIPEHATDLALKATVGEGAPYSEPYRLYNFDVFEYELDEPMALYGHIPMMLAHSKDHTSGVFWFNSAETYVDVGIPTTSGSVLGSLFGGKQVSVIDTHWFSETGIIDLFFFVGPRPKDVFRQFSGLVGTQELPPIFAIAYHQCRWNYQDEQDVHHVNHKFEEHNLPYDVLWLDIEHTDGKRYFTWDGKAFPTSVRMLDDLESYGRRMVTIVDPHIKRDSNYHIHTEATSGGYYVKDEHDNDYEGHCWPGSSSWVDFTNPNARQWWITKFSYSNYKGSTDSLFVWNDMNEPSVFNGPEVTMRKSAKHYKGWEHRDVHNIYGMLMHRATAEGLVHRNEVPHRPFVLSRAFFAGSQRWGAIWTGDNTASWEHLAAANPMLMSMGVAGMVFVGADVGGFFGNPEPELLVRWYQAAVYQPFFRAHAHLDTKRREPWLIGDQYFDMVQDAIETRYNNLPYIYTAFYHAFVDNTPVMRPLWTEYPEDPATFKNQDSYLLGSDLLVTPVTKKDQKTTSVYLPNHPTELWYDVDTYEAFKPNQVLTVDTPLDKIPVFQRGGSILPKKMRLRRSTVAMLNDPYTLIVAPDTLGSAKGDLYIDDTITFSYKKGEYSYRRLQYAQEGSTGTLESVRSDYPALGPNKTGGSYQSASTVERVVLLGTKQSPSKVTLQYQNQEKELSFVYDAARHVLTIKKPDCLVDKDWKITLSF